MKGNAEIIPKLPITSHTIGWYTGILIKMLILLVDPHTDDVKHNDQLASANLAKLSSWSPSSTFEVSIPLMVASLMMPFLKFP